MFDRASGDRADQTNTGWGSRKWRLLAFTATAAVILAVPLIAVGAVRGWWFTEAGGLPAPEGTVVVVKEGSWDGRWWAVTAYRTTDNLCFGLTSGGRSNESGANGGMSCGVPLRGIQPTRPGEQLHLVGFVSADADRGFPAWIAGPTAREVASVKIELDGGQEVTTSTFAAPSELGLDVNFYVARLPCGSRFHTLVSLDVSGNVLESWVQQPTPPGVPRASC